MFSPGHLLFIFISAVLIAAGTAACKRKKPAMRRMLLVCLVIALASELIKTLGNMQIVPIVKPVIENGKLIYLVVRFVSAIILMVLINLASVEKGEGKNCMKCGKEQEVFCA